MQVLVAWASLPVHGTQLGNDSDDEFYGSSVLGRPATHLQPNDNGRFATLRPASEAPSEAPSSRRSSVGSHTSKKSTWHPSGEPEPEYVARMLAKPFRVDPLRGSVDFEKATFYFKRAFHQQDYLEREYLTRLEVASMCEDAGARVGAQLNSQYLTNLIHAGDVNKDGRVDEDEFLMIMHNVLLETISTAGEQLHGLFSRVSDAADEEAYMRRSRDPYVVLSLPWGFSRGKGAPFYDEVEETEVSRRPPLLPLHSFTLMAQEVASRGVGIIDDADKYWTKALSQDLRKEFRDVLEPVRGAALLFTVFHNPSNQASTSTR